ncbi:hypothetical protein BC6307_18100 [Sutcliffiella cohnii]|uniref:Transposase n=1 Tax=Sutcliffiella cohnii TaxID=33932 RepID=A0A223KUM9_9BACI|nr:hypothetical protein [Sutcliffiella cohnii]AST93033.1 hypothetical protein BC6307_18100 [Sutcliffiella cohnii]
MSRELKVSIPSCYVWITEGNTKRAELFKRYVAGYVNRYNPGYELVKISGMQAIIKPKNDPR